METKSLAMCLVAPGRLEAQDHPLREVGPGEVRLGVRLAGICGTDLALWDGSYRVPLPLVPGHEMVATVDAVGPGVTNWPRGTRVVPEINATCLAWGRAPCPACAAGLDRHCLDRTVTGIDRHDGAFAEHCYVPAGCLHRVPDGMSDVRAVLVEPTAAAFQTFTMAGDPGGCTVVVLGPGRLGVLVVAVAASLGARVAAVGRGAASRERAATFGAEVVLAADDPDLPGRVRRWAGGMGADLVVECTGQSDAVARALDLVRPRGTVAVKSTPGLPGEVQLTRLVVQEVRLQGSRCGDFDVALDWLSRTPMPVESLLAATLPLPHLAEALEAARTRSKVLVDCAFRSSGGGPA